MRSPAGTLAAVLIAALCSLFVTPPVGPAGAQALQPGGTFVDDNGSVHEGNIEAIAAAGITRGCETDRYCPGDPVARGQMAAFLARALDLPSASMDYFSDDDGTTFESEINRIAAAGITLGCRAGAYCPAGSVTRGQMAAFLVRAYGYSAGSGDDTFTDDDASTFEDEIDRLAEAGITAGCDVSEPRLFCPDAEVSRGQMASFLARAEGLDPIVPPPPDCRIFPSDNIWNTRVDALPLDPRSAEYVASIGSSDTLHPDFGSGFYPPGSTSPIGIPYVEVGSEQPLVDIVWTAYGDESDSGPYPVPADAPIKGGPDAGGDRHVIVVDLDGCALYELFSAFPQQDGSWTAASGAAYDLRSHALRPDGWTSADAAGLPIYPGLVRYDEVASGLITHAIRFTAVQTRDAHVWPARHDASSISDLDVPPMGQRFRMKADFDITGFSPDVQVILTAFKDYGIILADNGSDWFISGAPDDRWDNDTLNEMKTVPGSAFEAVDVTGLIVDPDSGRATQP